MNELTQHMRYKTPLSKMVWKKVTGKMYTPMRVGYIFITVKINITIGYLIYKLATASYVPILALTV